MDYMADIENNNPTKLRDGTTGRVLAALRKEYVLVGRRHVRSWHAWFIIGIILGITVGIIIIIRGDLLEQSGAAKNVPVIIKRQITTRKQVKRFNPLPQNTAPFRYRSATAGREQVFSGGVIRGTGGSALQVDAVVYDTAVSGWRAKGVTIPYASIRKIYSLELPASGFLKRREIKRRELAPGMRIGIMRIGNSVDITMLPAAVPVATP